MNRSLHRVNAYAAYAALVGASPLLAAAALTGTARYALYAAAVFAVCIAVAAEASALIERTERNRTVYPYGRAAGPVFDSWKARTHAGAVLVGRSWYFPEEITG